MSRLDKKFILVSNNIDIKIKNNFIYCIKEKIIIKYFIPNYIDVLLNNNNKLINFRLNNNNKKNISLLGTFISILNNTIIGLNKKFEKKLILIGIGYKASIENNLLLLNVGFSHIIKYIIPNDIEIICSSNTEIIIRGFDKQLVGQVAARIRSYKPPENYRKGKGIRYFNEVIRIKEYKKQSK